MPEAIRLLAPTDLWALLDDVVRLAQIGPLAVVEATFGTAAAMQVVPGGDIDAMYWHFRRIQGREAWRTRGPLIERS